MTSAMEHEPGAELRLIGLDAVPEVAPGDDVARLVIEATAARGVALASGDVLVVTQKVVSKAEGRLVDLATVEPSELAQDGVVAWVLAQECFEVPTGGPKVAGRLMCLGDAKGEVTLPARFAPLPLEPLEQFVELVGLQIQIR